MTKETSPKPRTKPPGVPPYKNPDLPAGRRVKDLLARMTLEEKAAQMICVWQQKKENLVDDRGRFDPAKAKATFRERELARLPAVAIIQLFNPIRADFICD